MLNITIETDSDDENTIEYQKEINKINKEINDFVKQKNIKVNILKTKIKLHKFNHHLVKAQEISKSVVIDENTYQELKLKLKFDVGYLLVPLRSEYCVTNNAPDVKMINKNEKCIFKYGENMYLMNDACYMMETEEIKENDTLKFNDKFISFINYTIPKDAYPDIIYTTDDYEDGIFEYGYYKHPSNFYVIN